MFICDETNLRQQHSLRSWIQMGKADQSCGCACSPGVCLPATDADRACNPLQYWGRDCHFFEISVVEENIQGSIMPVNILKGTQGQWCQVASVQRPPGRQRFVLSYFEPCKPLLPFFHSLGDQPVNIYELVGDCPNPASPAGGWSAYVQAYFGVRFEMRRSPGRTTRVSQAPLDNQLMGTVDYVMRYTPMLVTQNAASTFAGGVHGIGYNSTDCNNAYYVLRSDTNHIVVEAYNRRSHSLKSYSVLSPTRPTGEILAYITQCGNKVFVSLTSFGADTTKNGLYVATVLSSGDLGDFRRISTDSHASLHSIGDKVAFGGMNGKSTAGKIYLLSSNACGSLTEVFNANLNISITDIDSCGDQLLAVGEDGFCVFSSTGGLSWRYLVSPTASTLSSCGIAGTDIWIGTVDGDLYVSSDYGGSWSLVASATSVAEVQLPNSAVSEPIYHIEFVNAYVGYFTYGSTVYSTYNGGAYWEAGCPRFEYSGAITQSNVQSISAFVPLISKSDLILSSNSFVAGTMTSIGASGNSTGQILIGDPVIENSLPSSM